MKLLYIINNGSKAGQYGIGTYIVQLLSGLRTCRSVQVTVIMLDSQENELTEKLIDGVKHLLFPTVRIHPSEKNYRRYARSVAYVLLPYVVSGADVIFHFNYSYHVWLAEAFKYRFPHCRTVLTLHYLPWCFDLEGNTYRFQSILIQKEETRDEFERQIYEEYLNDCRFYKEVDKVICLCQATTIFLQEVYDVPIEKTLLIYNGLSDDDACSPSACEKMNIKTRLGFKRDEKIILFVGRVNRLKGVHWLIDAFKKLLDKAPETRLVIAGGGNISDYSELCNDICGKVVFTGRINKEDLYAFYRVADLGVLPSYQEQCSYVGIEMMMHSLPVVGTNGMGISEMAEEEYQIQLNATQEEISLCTDKLSELMLKALANKEILGKQSRLRFEKQYSLNTMCSEMIRFYNND